MGPDAGYRGFSAPWALMLHTSKGYGLHAVAPLQWGTPGMQLMSVGTATVLGALCTPLRMLWMSMMMCEPTRVLPQHYTVWIRTGTSHFKGAPS